MGDLTKALQVLGKFEEIRSQGDLELDFSTKQFKIKSTHIPGDEEARQLWYREAFLYFKFKALSEFDENKDSILFTDIINGQTFARISIQDLAKQMVSD